MNERLETLRLKLRESHNETCPVCITRFELPQEPIALGCGHCFHFHCSFFLAECPLCRAAAGERFKLSGDWRSSAAAVSDSVFLQELENARAEMAYKIGLIDATMARVKTGVWARLCIGTRRMLYFGWTQGIEFGSLWGLLLALYYNFLFWMLLLFGLLVLNAFFATTIIGLLALLVPAPSPVRCTIIPSSLEEAWGCSSPICDVMFTTFERAVFMAERLEKPENVQFVINLLDTLTNNYSRISIAFWHCLSVNPVPCLSEEIKTGILAGLLNRTNATFPF